MEYCPCSNPDVWDTGDSLLCLSCGLAAPPPSRTPFRYSPLRRTTEFRLLRVFPGSRSDELACEVFHANITENPRYEAVSYTWGDTTLNQELHTKTGLLKVTNNCLSALKGLRHVSRTRTLWIDAICIAQANNLEKNHQIPLMPRIYDKAKRVLIYLGDETILDDTESLFGFLRKSFKAPPDHTYRQQFTEFLSLPWFSRIWILQEVAMAKRAMIIFGNAILDWDHLSIANIDALGLKPTNLRGQVPAVLRISKSDRKPLKDTLSMIQMARSCQCSDSRDKIYALLGLVDAGAGIDMVPDYRKSTLEVYTEITVQFLKAYNCLDFLSDVGKYKLDESFAVNLSTKSFRLDLDTQALRIQDLGSEVEKTAQRLDSVLTESLRRYGPGSSASIPLPESDLRKLWSNLSSIVDTKTTDLLVDLETNAYTQTSPQAFFNLLIDIAEEVERLFAREIDIAWIREAKEACKLWQNRLASTREQFLHSQQEIDEAATEAHGTFLTPENFFRPMPTDREDIPVIDSDLHLPSWVPDYRYNHRLFSFTRWRPNLFAGEIVAKYRSYTRSTLEQLLQVKAIAVGCIRTTVCYPGDTIQLGRTRTQITKDTIWSESTDLREDFERSLAETEHGATLDSIREFALGRRLVLTDTSLAIVPANFCLGDYIALIFGGTVPYLLRPIRQGTFKLIGECCLHGIKGPQFAPNYAELLGWFKDSVPNARDPEKLPWQKILLE